MNKKSRGMAIFNLVTSIVGVAVVGYFTYIFSVLLSLGFEQAETSTEKIDVILTTVAVTLPALMCLVNAVMACVSLKYLGRGENHYSKGFHIAMIVVELVALASFVVYGILNGASIVFLLISVAYSVIYGSCSIVHILELKKATKTILVKDQEEVANEG